MNIVVFGPEKRVGAVVDDDIVDLSAAYATLLHQKGEPRHTRSDLDQILDCYQRAARAL